MQENAATQAYNRQVQFWNMQNEYNKPSAQVQRLNDAGLNPALAYGQGGNVANTAGQLSSVPKADVYNSKLVDLQTAFDIAGQMSDLKTKEKQRQVMDAQIAQYESNVDRNTASIDQMRATVQMIELNKVTEGLRQKGLISDNVAKELANEMSSIDLFYRDLDWETKFKMLSLNANEIASRIGVNKSIVLKALSDIKNNDSQIKKRDAEIEYMSDQRKIMAKQGIKMDKDLEWYDNRALADLIGSYGDTVSNLIGSVGSLINPLKGLF